MIFEYIRPIDPSPEQSELEPEPATLTDAPRLAELISFAPLEETTPLACPELLGHRVELPRFSGISLADLVLEIPGRAPQPTPSLVAPVPPEPRALLGPGAMTMTLAFLATLMFGVAVAAQ